VAVEKLSQKTLILKNLERMLLASVKVTFGVSHHECL
jgi:hypothetical protein